MPMFSKQSLDELRSRIDLVEVIGPYVPLKKLGKHFKGLCPFHNEKTPSFIVEREDSHYHCFGCSAHGDAIAFLMQMLKISFSEAVEMLAEKFQVSLEYEKKDEKRQDLRSVKLVLLETKKFFHNYLLYTEEGRSALEYLYKRGIDLDFILRFAIGLAPKDPQILLEFFREKRFKREDLLLGGLIKEKGQPFFSERITFPILDVQENVIGFSARRYLEGTTGGKYINTPETPLFKKSKVLFGLNFSRKRIMGERRAIIVEGQIDCYRLIQEGLDYTVAGQGTAFGEEHVQILRRLGVQTVYLAFDGDEAGTKAAHKVGNLFQTEGIEALVLSFKKGYDPDRILKEEGIQGFQRYLESSKDYITFLVSALQVDHDIKTPAGKNRLAESVRGIVQEWKFPLMIHEAKKVVSKLLDVPETLVDIESKGEVKKKEEGTINFDRILESDLLRWLLIASEHQKDLFMLIKKNIKSDDFLDPSSKKLYCHLLDAYEAHKPVQLLSIAEVIEEEEAELITLIMNKKIQVEKAKEKILEPIKKILERNWMIKREAIKRKIHEGKCSHDEALNLAKEFDLLKKSPPQVELLDQNEKENFIR